MQVGVPLTYNHAIARGYRTHLNGTDFRTPFSIMVPPGGMTGWLEVGGWMDTLYASFAICPPPFQPTRSVVWGNFSSHACSSIQIP